MTWRTVKLGELARVRTGKLDANAADENGLYPFFTCAVEPLSINTPAFDCKAILVAGNGDLNVKYYEGKFNAYQRTYVIESLDEKIILPRYLYLFLNEYVNELRALAIGGVIKYIKLANLTDAPIPLPPLEEQQRIAAILDKAELLKRMREMVIEKLDELAKNIFIEMFGAEIKNSKSKVADFFIINDNKLNIRMNDEELIPFVPMAAVSEITKSVSDIQFRKFKEVKKGYTPIKKGDLIIAKITPCYENGKMALVNEITNDFAFGSTEFHTIRADNLNYLYLLFYYLDSAGIRKGGALNMKGAAGQRRVPAEYFSKLPFYIPNKEQIAKFVKIINKIKFERKIHCDSLENICNLQYSLKSQAFSGQL